MVFNKIGNKGRLAQGEERHPHKVEVAGSNPAPPILFLDLFKKD